MSITDIGPPYDECPMCGIPGPTADRCVECGWDKITGTRPLSSEDIRRFADISREEE